MLRLSEALLGPHMRKEETPRLDNTDKSSQWSLFLNLCISENNNAVSSINTNTPPLPQDSKMPLMPYNYDLSGRLHLKCFYTVSYVASEQLSALLPVEVLQLLLRLQLPPPGPPT